MAVMLPRERWGDDRLDQFERHVDERFDQVDQRIDQVDQRLDRFEGEVNLRFKNVDQRLDRIESDVKELRNIMLGGFLTLLVAIIGMNAF